MNYISRQDIAELATFEELFVFEFDVLVQGSFWSIWFLAFVHFADVVSGYFVSGPPDSFFFLLIAIWVMTVRHREFFVFGERTSEELTELIDLKLSFSHLHKYGDTYSCS